MNNGSFKDLVRLNKSQRTKLLDGLDNTAKAEYANFCNTSANRRQHTRYEYRVANIPVAIEHPGGSLTNMLVCGRNISSGGIAFVNGGYLHNGTRCGLVLTQENGEKYAIEGSVVNSRHIRATLHDVSVKFSNAIDISMFMKAEHMADDDNTITAPAVEDLNQFEKMTGRVLYVDSDADATSQFLDCIKKSKMQFLSIDSAEKALKSLSRDKFDILLIDFDEIKDDKLRIIGKLKRAGHSGPFVIVTDDSESTELESAMDGGATHVLTKPYEKFTVLNELRKCMKIVKTQLSNESSSVGDAEHAYKLATDLEEALKECNEDELMSLCSRMIKSPEAKIFLPIQEAAEAAIHVLNTDGVEKSIEDIERLVTRCNNILQWKYQGD